MKKNFNQCLSFQFQCNFFPRAMLVSFTSYVIAFNFRKLINNALNLCKLPLQMYNKLISRQFCCCTTICTQHSSRSSDKIACVNNLTETPKVFAMLNLKELPLYSNNNKTVTGEFIIDFYWISMYNCFALIVCVYVFDAEYVDCIENFHAYAKCYWSAVFRWRYTWTEADACCRRLLGVEQYRHQYSYTLLLQHGIVWICKVNSLCYICKLKVRSNKSIVQWIWVSPEIS